MGKKKKQKKNETHNQEEKEINETHLEITELLDFRGLGRSNSYNKYVHSFK